MAAGKQVSFSFLSFLRVHHEKWLQSDGFWRVGGGTWVLTEIISAERASTSCDCRQSSNSVFQFRVQRSACRIHSHQLSHHALHLVAM